MSMNERSELINRLEEKRSSKIITYITSDRENLNTQIAPDSVRLIYRHLQKIGAANKIDLFLYTTGGNLMAPIRIVHLIREHCASFEVLVPHRAMSAGTLLCMGADRIVMGSLAELSPVDPSTANAFNPADPLNPHVRIPISVEDVRAYLNLAKQQAGITSEDKTLEVFRALTNQINPIALGNVHRVYSEIRTLVESLLKIHMTSEDEKFKIVQIVESLTNKYTHDYPITRQEAGMIGLKVSEPDSETEDLMMQLFRLYEESLELQDPFNPEALLGDAASATFTYETAYIESLSRTDTFKQGGLISRIRQTPPIPPQLAQMGISLPPMDQISIKFLSRQWECIRDESNI